MWFRRADADHLRERARRFRSMTIDNDDTRISEQLRVLAQQLETEASLILNGESCILAEPGTLVPLRLVVAALGFLSAPSSAS